MNKGIIFVGCSFTWGQGLYYYTKMDTLKYPPNSVFYDHFLTDAHKKYMGAHRYGRLVANHFGTFDVHRNNNYGCEEQSLHFMDIIFDRKNSDEHFTLERYEHSEIEYFILQTSYFYRNSVKIIENGVECLVALTDNTDGKIDKLMFDMGINTFEELTDFYVKKWFDKIKTQFLKLENYGVKCRMICWYDDYLKYVESDDFMRDKFIPLYYQDIKFNTISELMDYDKSMNIKTDREFFGPLPPDDSHPSKKCHRVIADSIIKKIESENI